MKGNAAHRRTRVSTAFRAWASRAAGPTSRPRRAPAGGPRHMSIISFVSAGKPSMFFCFAGSGVWNMCMPWF